MPDNVQIHLQAGSKAWQAFLDGKASAFNIMWNLYGAPIAFEAVEAMDTVKVDTLKMLDSSVVGWEHQPDFEADVKATNITPEGIRVGNVPNVGATISLNFRAGGENGQIWRWVDKGTPPHPIDAPPPGPAMPIGKHVPSTIPGRISSRGPRQRGPLIVRTRHVNHPGISPRGFTDEINAFWGYPQREMRRRIDNAIKKARRRTGI